MARRTGWASVGVLRVGGLHIENEYRRDTRDVLNYADPDDGV